MAGVGHVHVCAPSGQVSTHSSHGHSRRPSTATDRAFYHLGVSSSSENRTEEPEQEKTTMASSASLLHSSTLAPAFSPPELRRGRPPPQLDLRRYCPARSRRGVSLAAAAASPDVEKEPSPSPPPPPNESALSVSPSFANDVASLPEETILSECRPTWLKHFPIP